MQNTTQRTKPTTVTVTCEFGTFTRKTARTYKYVFLVKFDENWEVRNWCGRIDLAWGQYADFKQNYITNPYYRATKNVSAVAIVRVEDGRREQFFETANWGLTDIAI
jgi:hypothetical protein